MLIIRNKGKTHILIGHFACLTVCFLSHPVSTPTQLGQNFQFKLPLSPATVYQSVEQTNIETISDQSAQAGVSLIILTKHQ